MRRIAQFIAFASLVLFFAAHADVAHAQEFPEKPVRIIVPFTPGGSTDLDRPDYWRRSRG